MTDDRHYDLSITIVPGITAPRKLQLIANIDCPRRRNCPPPGVTHNASAPKICRGQPGAKTDSLCPVQRLSRGPSIGFLEWRRKKDAGIDWSGKLGVRVSSENVRGKSSFANDVVALPSFALRMASLNKFSRNTATLDERILRGFSRRWLTRNGLVSFAKRALNSSDRQITCRSFTFPSAAAGAACGAPSGYSNTTPRRRRRPTSAAATAAAPPPFLSPPELPRSPCYECSHVSLLQNAPRDRGAETCYRTQKRRSEEKCTETVVQLFDRSQNMKNGVKFSKVVIFINNVVCETDGRGIFLENSLEGILDACIMTWFVEEDTFAGGLQIPGQVCRRSNRSVGLPYSCRSRVDGEGAIKRVGNATKQRFFLNNRDVLLATG
ncbi:hypothetical protein EAG_13526 [Camponotus floridanus]|uniref:Uncharacterized protein n=1 Tax=Camponotus floridanus TaxID=104421 RepID=E2ABL8_CAMFO|nr:hypothetical protein EAG_13526 [Camponotus floridanus]